MVVLNLFLAPDPI